MADDDTTQSEPTPPDGLPPEDQAGQEPTAGAPLDDGAESTEPTAAESADVDALKAAQDAIASAALGGGGADAGTAFGDDGVDEAGPGEVVEGGGEAGGGEGVEDPGAMAESALASAQEALIAAASASEPATNGASPQPVELPGFEPAPRADLPQGIDLLSDVNLNVKIELGRTRMLVEDVLKLSSGAIVELDKLAGDPVDIYVNDRPVARGEVLVLNDNFCVRVSEILSPTAGEGE